MNDQSSLSSSLSSHVGGQSTARSTASGSLEYDNSNLRRKLHELREEKSCLISENHGLVSEVEKVRFELHCAIGQLKPLQETAEDQRLREEELTRSLAEAKASIELKESERREWESRWKNSSLQLIESNSLIQHQTEMLLSLKQELTDLSTSKKVTEADRDTALTGAEQMRQSFVDFQTRLQSRLRSAEDQLSSSYDEREKLLADLVGRCLEIESLQSVQERLGAEVAREQNLRKSAKAENSELGARLGDCAQQIEKMEAELKRCEQLKNENNELKVGLEEKSRKLKCYEGELREYRTQLTNLESLAQNLQCNIVTSLRSCDGGEAVAVRRVVSPEEGAEADRRRTEDAVVVEELRSKLALAENELQQLRRKNVNDNNNDDSQALNGVLCETEDMGGVFQVESRISVDNWEASIQKLEEERQRHVASIAALERRIADLEVDKTSLGAQLTQRNSQIDDLQRDLQEQSVKAAMTERTLRRAALQTAALDRQLDERSAQVTTLVSQVDDLEESLRAKSEELRKRDEVMERRVAEAIGSSEATKQMSEKRCRELKGQLETAESRHRVTLNQLEQTERRSMSLQQTLTDMNVVLNTLRQELQQSSTLVLEEKERSDRMERKMIAASHEQGDALKVATAKLQAAEEQHHVEFSSMAKRVSDLEEELRMTMEAAEEKDDRLEPLEKELKETQARLLESSIRVEELEGLGNAVRMEKEEKEQALCREISSLKVLLESSEKKLGVATADIERREQQAKDLATRIRDLQLEKRQVIDELGNELKDTLKQLKNERRGNEKLSADLVSLQRESKQITESLRERQELMESLQQKLSDRDAELQERSQAAKNLFTECEKRKLEDETKEIRATELESRLRGRETELELSLEQLESLRQEMRRCRDELRCRQNVIDELNQEREQHQWELQQRAAQVTQLDMAMKERLAESEQRTVRLEAALQKTQLEVHQQGTQSKDLAEQTKGLTAALRQKSQVVHELEQVVRQLKAELDVEKESAAARGTEIEALGLEREGLVLSKRRSQEELAKASDQLKALQERLDGCEQRLAATEAEFDRATESLADARNSFKSQKLELEKLLDALAKTDKDRARLSEHLKRSENEYRLVNDQLTRELARLRDTHAGELSRLGEEFGEERQKRKAAEENEQQLKLELKRMSHQTNSLQMELDATRMIAGATKETSLIKDGEIARLKARISSIGRSQVTAAMETGCFVEPSHVTDGGRGQADCGCLGVVSSSEVQGQRPLHDGLGVDSQSDFAVGARNSPCKAAAESSAQVGMGQLSSNRRLQSSSWESCEIFSATESQPCKEQNLFGDRLPCPSKEPPCIESCFGIDADNDNPDSVQAMWNELQQGQMKTPLPSVSSTNSDREEVLPYRISSRATIGGATTSTGASDPRLCAPAARCNDPPQCGGNLEERLRVQNRIKTLIGYKEPTRKTISASSLNSDSSSRSSGSSRQMVTGGNWRAGNNASTAVSQIGRARNSTKRRIQDEREVGLRGDTDCSSST